ncbi:MAG: hypothetical protein E6Q46_07710 [Flavobacterium sp.]|nr:MAG: hypothetical protein E6Q46_07710 [Flavobacterium sp.]
MRKILLLYCILLLSCDKFQSDKATEKAKLKFDTISYIYDTIYNNVEISGSKFKLKIVRNKFDDNFNKYEGIKNAPPTLLLSDEEKDLYYKSFGSLEDKGFTHEIDLFKIDKEIDEQGKLFVQFKVFGQDTRYSAYLYYLSRESGKFKLMELLDYTPESIVLFNKNESVLFLKEIWSEDETYGDCHQYIVKEFIFENGYFSENEKGTTKAKHCLSGSQNLKEDLKTLFQSEIEISKNINVKSYLNMID